MTNVTVTASPTPYVTMPPNATPSPGDTSGSSGSAGLTSNDIAAWLQSQIANGANSNVQFPVASYSPFVGPLANEASRAGRSGHTFYKSDAQYFQAFKDIWDGKNKRMSRSEFVLRAIASGLLSQDQTNNFSDVNAAWDKLGEYSKYYAGRGQFWTPLDVLMMNSGSVKGLKGAASHNVFTSTTAQTSTPETARAMASAVLLAALGRNATDKELSDFAGALRQYEEKHPSVTTQTTDGSGNSSYATSGGLTEADRTNYLDQRVFGGALRNEANANAMNGYVEELQKMLGNA